VYKKTVLDSGVTVVTEAHKYQRSVSVGAFIEIGTRDEPETKIGISHFVEHMVFKGTKNRTTSEINMSIEAVGGDLNAYTTREYTCFQAVSLKDDLELDIEVLGDLCCNAQFTQKDFDLEKKVILQEIAMNEDNPEEYIYDLFFEKIYGTSPLGRPILGTKKSLENLKRPELMKYYKEHYAGSKVTVAAAGALDHDEVVEMVEKYFSSKKIKASKLAPRKKPRFIPVREIMRKEGEQTHLLVGFNGVGFLNPKRYAAFVLNAWLGGGMSSKLYQSIREKRGLAYTIYSNLTTFMDCGTLSVYVACDGKSIPQVMDAIHRDISDLKKKKLNPKSLDMFKAQVRGGILLGSDDMENRMTSLAANEMAFDDYMPVDTFVEGIERVTAKDVRDLAQELLDIDKMAVLVMGDVDVSKTKIALNKSGLK
jgi:predicted Zn-dependent peptidase